MTDPTNPSDPKTQRKKPRGEPATIDLSSKVVAEGVEPSASAVELAREAVAIEMAAPVDSAGPADRTRLRIGRTRFRPAGPMAIPPMTRDPLKSGPGPRAVRRPWLPSLPPACWAVSLARGCCSRCRIFAPGLTIRG